jgi:hypothetical protein
LEREWIVLLEAAPEETDGGPAVCLSDVEEFLGMLADYAPSALYAPDRYAVQITVPAGDPQRALAAGVDRFHLAVSASGLPGWPLVRAEVKTPAELEAELRAEEAPLFPPVGTLTVDADALAAAYQATRAILSAVSEKEVTVILATLVHRLGGAVVPASRRGPDTLAIELTFGGGDPLMVAAEPVSIARLRLEELLPSVVDDARAMVGRLRSGELGLTRHA